MKTKTQNVRRTDKLSGETNDCTVQALANVTGIPYAEAHGILAAQGRVERNGHHTCLAQTRKSFEGRFLVHEVRGAGLTLAQFAKDNWTGSFYVSVRLGGRFDLRNLRSHKVAVVNGVIVDNLPKSWLRGRVACAWEFERRLSYKADVAV
jgi:hypothetical protein